MKPDPRDIAAIAERVAPYYAEHGLRWAANRNRLAVPTAAEIALVLSRIIGDVTPGGAIETGGLRVEWPVDEGEPQNIRVFLHLGALEPEESR